MSAPPEQLSGRRALVTGGGSGIGAACAALLARQGAAVAVLDVREAAAAEVASAIVADDGRAVAVACDVARQPSVEEAVRVAAAELGGIDTVVAAAGITRSARTHLLTLQEWDALVGVNLTGVFLTIRETLNHLLAAGHGSIVTIGSVASLVAAGRSAAYDAAKGGVLQLTRGVAAEYAERGIRANCVCPGLVATNLAETSERLHGPPDAGATRPTALRTRPPIERAARPEEIAAVVAFLCSEAASFMTGAAVPVDGGFTAI